ncbi:MAG: LacI family DNA-binding transcriptional regulator [Bacillus subtilis]|nr:LacI family DNA-binding transcriptional regulator [Bacillus subtilis]
MAKITLDKIAEEIGVSKVAVSKALNDQKGVSEQLRQTHQGLCGSGRLRETHLKRRCAKQAFFVFDQSGLFFDAVGTILFDDFLLSQLRLQQSELPTPNRISRTREHLRKNEGVDRGHSSPMAFTSRARSGK